MKGMVTLWGLDGIAYSIAPATIRPEAIVFAGRVFMRNGRGEYQEVSAETVHMLYAYTQDDDQ